MNRVGSVLVAATVLISSRAVAGDLVVGILEHPQCKQEPLSAVRPLFHKHDQQWAALSSEELSLGVPLADVSWTVALNGSRLGSIKTVDPGFSSPYAWTYARDRLLVLAPDQPIPAVANGQSLFGGWCEVPENRPLVVISRPNLGDPDGWKRFNPDSTLRSQMFARFAAAAGEANTCESQDAETPSVWAYSADDLLVSSSYQDHAGRRLVALALNPTRNHCDGPRDDAWSTYWFLVVKDSITPLGANLSLVDAGDYDADGSSELLFWYSGYNKDGYSLFYDGLRKRVDYQWSYH